MKNLIMIVTLILLFSFNTNVWAQVGPIKWTNDGVFFEGALGSPETIGGLNIGLCGNLNDYFRLRTGIAIGHDSYYLLNGGINFQYNNFVISSEYNYSIDREREDLIDTGIYMLIDDSETTYGLIGIGLISNEDNQRNYITYETGSKESNFPFYLRGTIIFDKQKVEPQLLLGVIL